MKVPKKRSILHKLPAAAALLLLVCTVFLTGCGKEEEGQRYAYPLATASPEDTVTQIYAEKFAKEVDRLSDGRIKIQVYSNSTLGGDRELLESCKDGDIPFVVQNTAPQVTFMPDLAVFDVPCAFENLTECREVMDDSEFSSMIHTVYEKGGYRLLGISDQGFRVMSTNKAVYSIKDFKGQKIRTMENPYEVIVSNKLYEQQDYIVETNHLPHLITLIMNDDFYKNMPAKNQKIMRQAAAIATAYSRKASDDRIADRMKTIRDSGTKILKLNGKTRKAMINASAGVREDIRKSVDSKLYDKYMELIEAHEDD